MSKNVDDSNDKLPTADLTETLNLRYREFARHMADSGNATDAARRAGYSEDNAGQQGYRLMQRPEVLAMVEEARAERAHRLRVTDDRIIEAYAALAFGDSRRVVTWDDNGSGSIIDSGKLTEDEALRIQSVERIEKFDREGNPVITVKVTLAPRQPALDALAKIKGLMRERIEIDGLNGVSDEMAELRARRRARLGDKARAVDAVIIDDEPARPTPLMQHAIDIHGDMTSAPPPGIAQRFASRIPREG